MHVYQQPGLRLAPFVVGHKGADKHATDVNAVHEPIHLVSRKLLPRRNVVQMASAISGAEELIMNVHNRM